MNTKKKCTSPEHTLKNCGMSAIYLAEFSKYFFKPTAVDHFYNTD